ncbi:MAG: hypothetical protein ACI92G_000112 [Candidatus Pelagisphaera sp.]|jgi:hypothetical protein
MNVLFRFRACGWIGLGVMALSPSYAVDFDKQILPILEEKCYRCHGDEKVKGELRLDSPEAILAGGEYGEILIPGDPNESSLYVLTTYPKDDADYMPQKGKGLTVREQKLLKQWIEDGAPFGESFVHVPAPEIRSKFEEADPANERRYNIMGDAVEIVARLREAGLQVDTVNHDASRFEINYTYAERAEGAFAFDTLAELGDTLVKLTLARTDVTDGDLEGIVDYSNIEHLDLGRTSIGDGGLEYVSKLENLKVLNLRDTNVTDAGLEKLVKLKSLERVYLWGSQVTASGAKRLEKSLGEGKVILGGELVGPRRRPGQQT